MELYKLFLKNPKPKKVEKPKPIPPEDEDSTPENTTLEAFKTNSLQKFKEWWSRLAEEDDKTFEEWRDKHGLNDATIVKNYEALVLYCESNGKVYRDYKAALKNFCLKDVNNQWRSK
jgi:hypothetical protein